MKRLFILLFLFILIVGSYAQDLSNNVLFENKDLRDNIKSSMIKNSSGNQEWDQKISDIYVRISKFYGLDCPMVYVTDLYNGFYNPTKPRDSVFLGIPHIELYMKLDSSGQLLMRLIAHELSHAYQFHNADKNYFLTNRSTVKYLELQADFLASYTLCHLNLADDSFVPLYEKFVLEHPHGDYGFKDEQHHGTPTDRLKATKDGQFHCINDLEDAYNNSYVFIKPSWRSGIDISEGKLMGDITLLNGEKYYLNTDNEVFTKMDNGYSQVGTVQPIEVSIPETKWYLIVKEKLVILTVQWEKVFDENHNNVGTFTFYKQNFQGN